MSDHTLTFITITDAMYVFEVEDTNTSFKFLFQEYPAYSFKFYFKDNSFVCEKRINDLLATKTYKIRGSIFPFENGEVEHMTSIVESLTTKNRIK
jgi:hypothetical protein